MPASVKTKPEEMWAHGLGVLLGVPGVEGDAKDEDAPRGTQRKRSHLQHQRREPPHTCNMQNALLMITCATPGRSNMAKQPAG